MTNFLTRLVGRTLGTMPLVQPRIASIYEEQGSAVGADFTNHPQTETDNLTKPAPVSEQRSRGEGEFAPSLMPNSLRFSQIPTEVSPLGKTGIDISEQPISSNLVDKDLPKNASESVDFVEDELTIKTRSNIKSRAGETPTPQEFLDNSILDKIESTPVLQEPLSAISTRIVTKVERAVEKNERKAKSLSEEITPIPESARHETQQNFPNPTSGRDEEIGKLPITNYPSPITNYQLPITQTIKVSIGRIEVRAIPAPPAPPAPRKSIPTPKLSLSDYLRQHGGGG